MSMPEIQKRQWQLMWGIIFVFFMIWVEYECRISVQDDLMKQMEILQYDNYMLHIQIDRLQEWRGAC